MNSNCRYRTNENFQSRLRSRRAPHRTNATRRPLLPRCVPTLRQTKRRNFALKKIATRHSSDCRKNATGRPHRRNFAHPKRLKFRLGFRSCRWTRLDANRHNCMSRLGAKNIRASRRHKHLHNPEPTFVRRHTKMNVRRSDRCVRFRHRGRRRLTSARRLHLRGNRRHRLHASHHRRRGRHHAARTQAMAQK